MAPWTEADIPDQTGRVAVITGANSGLGLATATALAGRGARVLLACRSPERGERALALVRATGGAAELVRLDLADLASVRTAATEIRDRTGDRLDLLINNAGVMATPLRRTADGFELQFGTNHLGHAALTWQLMPALRAAGAARVVTVASLAHQYGRIDLADPNYQRRRYFSWTAYGQSKLANLLFSAELARRAAAAGSDLVSVAAHPGLASTELATSMARSRRNPIMSAGSAFYNRVIAQSAARGALPQLHAATAPGVRGGEYYGPDGFREMRGHPARAGRTRAARDERTAAALWDRTAELTGVSPDPA